MKRLAAWLVELSRVSKQSVVITIDIILCAAAVWLAFDLRLDRWTAWEHGHWRAFMVSVGLVVPIFVSMGLYRAIFRYSGLPAILSILKAISLYSLIYISLFTVVGVPDVPRSIGILQPLLLLLGVVLSRVVARMWLGDLYQTRVQQANAPRVLIYGAGSAGRQLAAGLKSSSEVYLIGFLDDDQRLHGQTLNGAKIFNPLNLVKVVMTNNVTQIYLAIPSATRAKRNEILESVRALKVQVRTLPSLMDLAEGRVQVSDLKELDIEDLLGRDPVPPNAKLLTKNIKNKTVIVTGAGGSIGSELCRQIIKQSPKTLLLLEMTEFALYEIHHELEAALASAQNNEIEIIPLLGNVQDSDRMRKIFNAWRPQTVYHAAAYKHVPLVQHNVVEGVRNNVIGTMVAATQAAAHGVEDFVLISTDKAVRPTNVMGASKRMAELVLQAQAQEVRQTGGVTRFSMVRFGNVLGSSGSVVPLFRRQIKEGGPITLTHADITRYFMTIPEAAQLVIQAGAMAEGGDVFVLDMGEPVKIIDLAKRMVELSGLQLKTPEQKDGDIEIQITGLRPGEKLYEELLIGENPLATSHQRIMKAHEGFTSWPELQRQITNLMAAFDKNDIPAIQSILISLVSGYQIGTVNVDFLYGKQPRQLAA
jgi:FlaA1/EpsC-like NDP-sugar epimerase